MQQPETTQMRRKNRKKILAAKYVAAGCESRIAKQIRFGIFVSFVPVTTPCSQGTVRNGASMLPNARGSTLHDE